MGTLLRDPSSGTSCSLCCRNEPDQLVAVPLPERLFFLRSLLQLSWGEVAERMGKEERLCGGCARLVWEALELEEEARKVADKLRGLIAGSGKGGGGGELQGSRTKRKKVNKRQEGGVATGSASSCANFSVLFPDSSVPVTAFGAGGEEIEIGEVEGPSTVVKTEPREFDFEEPEPVYPYQYEGQEEEELMNSNSGDGEALATEEGDGNGDFKYNWQQQEGEEDSGSGRDWTGNGGVSSRSSSSFQISNSQSELLPPPPSSSFYQFQIHPCRVTGCGFVASTVEVLREHRKEHHSSVYGGGSGGERGFLTCSTAFCKEQFTERSDLLYHEVRCGWKKHACTWPGCDKRFRTGSLLHCHVSKYHKKRGQGMIENVCGVPGCGQSFGNRSRLKIHEARCRFKWETLRGGGEGAEVGVSGESEEGVSIVS